jgi:hypothetical protein
MCTWVHHFDTVSRLGLSLKSPRKLVQRGVNRMSHPLTRPPYYPH